MAKAMIFKSTISIYYSFYIDIQYLYYMLQTKYIETDTQQSFKVIAYKSN